MINVWTPNKHVGWILKIWSAKNLSQNSEFNELEELEMQLANQILTYLRFLNLAT